MAVKTITVKDTDKALAVWDNVLVNGVTDLTVTEFKLMVFISAHVERRDKAVPEVFRFRTADVLNALGLGVNNSLYFESMLKELRTKTVEVENLKENSFAVMGWLDYAKVWRLPHTHNVNLLKYILSEEEREKVKDEDKAALMAGTTEIRIGKELAPFILGLKKRFTEIQVKYIMGFTSKYAARIYVLAKQYEDTGWREDDEENLRRILGLIWTDKNGKVVEVKYREERDFRKNVLRPALLEINGNDDETKGRICAGTDIKVKIKKRGNAYLWDIKPSKPPEALTADRRNTSAANVKKMSTEEEAKRFEKLKKEALKLARWMAEYEADTWAGLDRAERDELVAVAANQLSLQFPGFDVSEKKPEDEARCHYFFTCQDPNYLRAAEQFNKFGNDFKLYTEIVLEAERLGVPVTGLTDGRLKRLAEGLTKQGFFKSSN